MIIHDQLLYSSNNASCMEPVIHEVVTLPILLPIAIQTVQQEQWSKYYCRITRLGYAQAETKNSQNPSTPLIRSSCRQLQFICFCMYGNSGALTLHVRKIRNVRLIITSH